MTSPPGNGRQPEPARHDDEPLYSPAEVAEMLGGGNVTARTVVRRWRAWGLHPCKIGRELRFEGSDVRAMIAAHKIPPQPAGPGTANTPAAPRRRRT
jgi:hypothetical protein